MALTNYTGSINTIQSLSDRPNQEDGLTPAQLKLKFDQAAIDIQNYINNTLIPQLIAGNIPISSIGGLTATHVQAALAELKTQLSEYVLGGIPNGTITDVKLSDSMGTVKKPNANLLKNSSGQFGLKNWVDGSSTKIVPTFNNGENYFLSTQSNTTESFLYLNNTFNVMPSNNITLSADFKTIGIATGSISILLTFYTSGGTFISQLILTPENGLQWHRLSNSAIVPSTASYAIISIVISGNTTNTNCGWRRIKVEYGSSMTPYSLEADVGAIIDDTTGDRIVLGVNNGGLYYEVV